MGQADEAAAGNQSEIRCLSRTDPCRCLRETAWIGTGTPPRETAWAMFASARRERNGQASNGTSRPCVGGDRRKGRGRCFRAAGRTERHGRKARLRTGWSGLQRSGGAFGQGQEDAATAATEPDAFGQRNRREVIERNDPSGIVSIDDRTAMPDRRKAQRDRKDIEAGTRLFGTAPVPVTDQRTHRDRWNAWFRSPLPVSGTLPAATMARPSPGWARAWLATPGGWRKRWPPFGFGVVRANARPASLLPLSASGERAMPPQQSSPRPPCRGPPRRTSNATAACFAPRLPVDPGPSPG